MQRRPKNPGTFKVGSGHSGNTKLPPLQPMPLPDRIEIARLTGEIEADSKGYRMGQCTVIVSHSDQGWHFSIAHPTRYPTWDEVAKVRYELIPDEAQMAMMLPPRSEYVNIHNFCFQCHEVSVGEDVIKAKGEQH
jgi:hypothetical protein